MKHITPWVKLHRGNLAWLVIFLCMKSSLKKVSPRGNQVLVWLIYLMQNYPRFSICCICYFGSEVAHAQESVTVVAVRLAVFMYRVCWSLFLVHKKKKKTKKIPKPQILGQWLQGIFCFCFHSQHCWDWSNHSGKSLSTFFEIETMWKTNVSPLRLRQSLSLCAASLSLWHLNCYPWSFPALPWLMCDELEEQPSLWQIRKAKIWAIQSP